MTVRWNKVHEHCWKNDFSSFKYVVDDVISEWMKFYLNLFKYLQLCRITDKRWVANSEQFTAHLNAAQDCYATESPQFLANLSLKTLFMLLNPNPGFAEFGT